jgi:hypothetical protein
MKFVSKKTLGQPDTGEQVAETVQIHGWKRITAYDTPSGSA